MFDPRPCAEKGCGRPALSGAERCIVHVGDPAQHVASILQRAGTPAAMRDLDLPGISLIDVDLSGAEISGCRLTAASFFRVKFTRAQIHLSFLDRATFTECDFTGATLQNTVLAGSSVTDCTFEDCEILQANFLGIRGVRCVFDHSNLYGSRFIGSLFEQVSMRDCNLTRAGFDSTHRAGVDFHASNTNEASFLEPVP
jgi:uncharacterized protein YjbI with pentapeptide repeats